MKSTRFEFAKHILLLALGLCFLAGGNAKADNSKLRPGLIVVAKVEGTVEAIDAQGKTTAQLKRSDMLSEKYTVKVGAASSATLAFSNGAVINLLENTTMVISEFLQDPFAAPFESESAMTEEPTTSVTKLQLVQGEIIGTVKKLRTEQGSSLVVNTPVGAAGVRGTTFSVSYRNGNYVLSVTEGAVEITIDGKTTLVEAGSEFTLAGGTGKKVGIGKSNSNRINQIAQNGKNASRTFFDNPLNQAMPNEWNVFLGKQKIGTIKPKKLTSTNP